MDASPDKHTILVVDDEPHALEILTRRLGREGYECLTASSGPEALQLLKGSSVDVILLDVMMPDMDGIEVCEALRDDPDLSQIPVMLLTARDDLETRSRGMMVGVSEFLTKPISREELFARVAAQLRTRDIGRKLNRSSDQPDDK